MNISLSYHAKQQARERGVNINEVKKIKAEMMEPSRLGKIIRVGDFERVSRKLSP